MEIACLDLGSNSFHLEHFRVSEAGCETVLDVKRSVRLGDSVSRSGGIDGRGWSLGYSAVDELLALSSARRPHRRVAVATSAIRSASNGEKFLSELRAAFDLEVDAISPEREAELSYLGATTDPRVNGRRCTVIDVGGGSTELAFGQGARCVVAGSVPIGTLSLSALLETLGDGARAPLPLLEERFAPLLGRFSALQPERVVFASGVARAVRKLALRGTALEGSEGPLETAHVLSSLARHGHLDPAGLVRLGVEPSRADTILLAHSLLLCLLRGLGVESGLVTKAGLRTGMALQAYRSAQSGRAPSTSGRSVSTPPVA
jgi:exopolyphosphatase/guanosine-5'-triphosphate,3'-diphosphate pyrophosphatase